MNLALYGSDGFYSERGAGRRGDFITSPEVGPLFGTVIANMIDDQWRRQGKPTEFVVAEYGAGPGSLARSIFAASPECVSHLKYFAIEVSSIQRAKHPDLVQSVAELPEGTSVDVTFANELLDNLPFQLFVYDSSWREAYVSIANDGKFVEVLRAPKEKDLQFINAIKGGRLGSRIPKQSVAQRWLMDALAATTGGKVVVIDYARARTADVIDLPWRQWLRTYREHERGSHYLSDVGLQDITGDVMIDQLMEVEPPLNVRTQAQFLQLWGIDELVTQGQEYWSQHAAHPDVLALKMRSRVSEAAALLDSNGLGGFSVIEWG